MKKFLALALAGVLSLGLLAGCTNGGNPTPGAGSSSSAGSSGGSAEALNVAVFYYNYADVYISSVRNYMDEKLTTLGVQFQNYDGGGNQTTQSEQIATAITNGVGLLIVNIVENSSDDAAQNAADAAKAAGIPIIFFNRDFGAEVIKSYDKAAFVGTDAPEAGHMQGKMIANYLLADYDTYDLNGDGIISYVMFKGQEANVEAEYRTQYAVEDADAILVGAGKQPLSFYDAGNANKYLVDQNGNWSAAAATEYMDTVLAQYNEANKNMIELVIANNDDMASGAISSLQAKGYNTGEEGAPVIPVFGVDAIESAKQLIAEGKMTGTIMQDAAGMADTICALVANIQAGADLMANTAAYNVDADVAKIRVPYGIYTGE